MAVTEAPPVGTDAARAGRSTVSLEGAVRWGLFCGLALVFVSAIGMVDTFAGRNLIGGTLSLGYVTLFAVALAYGYLAGRPPPLLEGYEAPKTGLRNVLAGLISGAIGGAILILFIWFISTVNIRSIFINVSPGLVEELTFGQEVKAAIPLTMLWATAFGAAGGAIHLMKVWWRRPLLNAVTITLALGMLREAFTQILNGLSLTSLTGFLYARGGGLSIGGAIVVAVLFFALFAYLGSRRGVLRSRVEAMSPAQRRTFAIGAIVFLVVILAVLPLILGSLLTNVLDFAGIFLLMALGLNIVVGHAGLLDLGYVAFFAVGAYATAVLTSPNSPLFDPQLAFWTALPFVVLAAAFAGVLVGTPVLRMRGDYLAIVTLGFGEIARILFLSDWFKPVFGGAQGITQIPNIEVGPFSLSGPVELFYPIAAFVLIAAYISWALRDSRIGRAWNAMREDEPIAEVVGINIVTAKLSAFIVGAVLASFGGALFGVRIGSIFPNSFSIIVSIIVLVIIIVGGMGSIPGVVVGALLLVAIPELTREFEEYRFLLYGALLIFMMLKRPEGLIPSKRRAQELHQEEVMQDAFFEGTPGPEDRPAVEPDKES